MKKLLAVYIIGVVIGWFIGFSHIRDFNKKHNLKTTYGDIAFCSTMSLFSWAHIVSLLFIKAGESDFWSTPINN